MEKSFKMHSTVLPAFFLVLAVAFTAGCSGGDSEKGPGAKEVVEEYADTLATAPEKAKEVREKVETRTSEALESVDKLPGEE